MTILALLCLSDLVTVLRPRATFPDFITSCSLALMLSTAFFDPLAAPLDEVGAGAIFYSKRAFSANAPALRFGWWSRERAPKKSNYRSINAAYGDQEGDLGWIAKERRW